MEHRQDFPQQVEEAPQQQHKALAVVDFQVLSRRVVECHQCSFRLDRPDLAVEDLQADRDLVVVDHREAGLAAEDHQVEGGLAVACRQVDRTAAGLVEVHHLAEDRLEGHRGHHQLLGWLLRKTQTSSPWA